MVQGELVETLVRAAGDLGLPVDTSAAELLRARVDELSTGADGAAPSAERTTRRARRIVMQAMVNARVARATSITAGIMRLAVAEEGAQHALTESLQAGPTV